MMQHSDVKGHQASFPSMIYARQHPHQIRRGHGVSKTNRTQENRGLRETQT